MASRLAIWVAGAAVVMVLLSWWMMVTLGSCEDTPRQDEVQNRLARLALELEAEKEKNRVLEGRLLGVEGAVPESPAQGKSTNTLAGTTMEASTGFSTTPEPDGRDEGPPSPPRPRVVFAPLPHGQKEYLVIHHGKPSTYQTEDDFSRRYVCNRPGKPTCRLRVVPETSFTNPEGEKLYESADLLLYRAWYVPRFDNRFPHYIRRRHPRQQWAIEVDESPKMLARVLNSEFTSLFNFTVSYRQNSDIPFAFGPCLERVLDPPLPVAEKVKGAPIAWIAQNCEAFNRRQLYVRQLMRHTTVHSFGKCLKNRDFPDSYKTLGSFKRTYLLKGQGGVPGLVSSSLEKLLGQYKFYLAFENSNCDDYVTEKFWRTLYAGAVPIVMGAPNIMQFAPSKHSIIRVADFRTPELLAKHINMLDKNDTAYEEYFAYRRDPSLLSPSFRRMAELQNITVRTHNGYAQPMEQVMCNICYRLQSNITSVVGRDKSCQ